MRNLEAAAESGGGTTGLPNILTSITRRRLAFNPDSKSISLAYPRRKGA